ncbi:hypothetical protein QQS21_001506 [Conoideocrella luteorostrata]|uniref:Uncharacterized protein n=1 Tax=Conoideocrella luteorostrata TaxID=1105319 RepID=A0AAJ0G1Y9_9HYPO|nr:hypothetical protein QQS21_001506 [Conoideocrella luteorostrata]
MSGIIHETQRAYQAVEPITPAGGKSKEEYDKVLSRLSDQSFTPRKYPDPLVPRQGVDTRFCPQGVTSQMEEEWLARIKVVQEDIA